MAIEFHKVGTLPGVLEPDSFYFVENGSYSESYITDTTGQPKAIGNSAMINALIAAELANWTGASNQLQIVPDIAAKDLLVGDAEINLMILVVDASDDPTVDSGSALYAYDLATDETYKVAEYESMDLVLDWEDMVNGPTSSAAQIDSAVSQAHTHANKVVLDLLSEDTEQQLLFRGDPISTNWTTNNW